MKNNKGFTLVELLAVVAILSLLVIIALPNIMAMFKDAKENAFLNECKQIYKTAQSQWMTDSMFNTDSQTYVRCKSGVCPQALKMSGREELEYYVKFNKSGQIVNLYATDGSYQYSYNGPGLKVEDITTAVEIANNTTGVLTISCSGVTEDVIPPVSEESFLMAGTSGEPDSVFLRTNITKRNIEQITFTNTLAGHTANGTDCFDVSAGENGSVLAWATDSDSNGKYEITIGTDGKIYLSTGKFLFHRMQSLKRINGWENMDTSQATSMYHMFFGCWNLESIDLSHFNTAKVTDMNAMFGQLYKVTSLDLSPLNTSKVENMVGLFENSRYLRYIDISTFDLSSINYMARMFWNCESLEEVNWGNIDTSRVQSISGLFEGCTSLETIDLSIFKNAHLTDMSTLFKGCSNLKNINLSQINTSSVTNMSETFANMNNIEVLDISNFNTANVTNMYQMFINSPKLRTIYASPNFVTTALSGSASDQNMFYKDESLVGGAGTAYDSTKPRGKARAHIDGGEADPGYFTLR